MSGIALVTDSTCDLPAAGRLKYGAVVVPLHVSIGDATYVDGIDMNAATFYKRFAEAGQTAHSSQPSAGEFKQVYADLLESHDSVVSVHISGRLSGTVGSADTAAADVDPGRVRVVDSCRVSVGLGLVVQATGEAILGGASLDGVVAAAKAAARETRVWGVVPSLEVAVHGGRVSARMAHLADSVELKPIIAFGEEGATYVDGARVGFNRALRAVAHRVVRFAAGSQVRVSIAHADGPAAAYYLRERLSRSLARVDIPILEAGAVITTHVGLGTVAVGVQRLVERSSS